ncbi:MAG TPA: OsmC family protein [Dongiaceae bacterium]
MAKEHRYAATVEWTGNQGAGTSNHKAYSRAHEIRIAGKPPIPGSSDPSFCGDPSRYNPEDLLVASLSGCHMLWYLHLCSTAGIVVTGYVDAAEGTMIETPDGSGRFTGVVLKPEVTVQRGADLAKARELHAAAHKMCFIANSMNFPVTHEPTIREQS